jgi:hypothetical protein
MEIDMRHALKNSIKENMHALLECTFVDYANLLRTNYPGKTIRNAAVFVSGVPEFARLGLIELVDARTGIREGIPDFIARRIKRSKHQAIWIPGPNFPADPMDIYDQMKPFSPLVMFGSLFVHILRHSVCLLCRSLKPTREARDRSNAPLTLSPRDAQAVKKPSTLRCGLLRTVRVKTFMRLWLGFSDPPAFSMHVNTLWNDSPRHGLSSIEEKWRLE